MAKARIIVKRRKAVRNIRKITKVMQMIASSRYQKAYKRAMGTKPYVKKIAEMVASAVQNWMRRFMIRSWWPVHGG